MTFWDGTLLEDARDFKERVVVGDHALRRQTRPFVFEFEMVAARLELRLFVDGL